MDIRSTDPSITGGGYGDNSQESTQPTPPPANDVNTFNQSMKDCSSDSSSSSCNSDKGGENGKSDGSTALDDPQTKEVLTQVLQLLQQLIAQISDDGQANTKGGSTIGEGSNVKPVEGSGPGGSAGTGNNNGSNQTIPPPSEHIQELNLGGKTVTVGGDGTASAEEVGKTAQSIEQMYQNSPTFKNMIDNSSDPSFEVSVGKRDDNTSWGNSEGRVFMNINNIEPSNSDSWQSLLTHEFAHASIDLGHGAEMERIEQQAANEA